jgi:SprT protein
MLVFVCYYRHMTKLQDSDSVQPIGPRQQREVATCTEAYIAAAETLLQRSFDRIPVLFDLRGSTAGMFRLQGRRREIRFNPWIFAKHYEENLAATVPHEVAHYIVHELYGLRRVKPHGAEWRAVMAAFGADDAVTFDLDLEGVPRRRQRTHPYQCSCRLHQISTTRHNRVQAGRGHYQCRHCNGQLCYAG